ncbi:MAG: biotin carboxylase N-terminal domain-containing protein [Myxococcota bacterium]
MSDEPVRTFHRILVANRGEVAARVARTARQMGIEVVFAVSEADYDAPWTRLGSQVLIGPARASESYLDPERLVQAAKQTNCSALHPGWGFLAENPTLVSLAEAHGVTFIGPPAHVMHLMGKKTPAKRAMKASGLRVIDGSDGVLAGEDDAKATADRVGYPVLFKAESGGGGRGMRIARSKDETLSSFRDATAEAFACFADRRVYLEKLVEGGRHIELQLIGDRYGHVVHLGERDCTIQRNHQKLVEESPAPGLDPDELARTLAAAVRATSAIGYVGAGTMEFLLDAEGKLRFMEMNTRLQVEHTVSEVRSGVDLVREQILVAAGHPLSFDQSTIRLEGHAIECRINAEDPADNFRPAPGVLEAWRLPENAPGIRVDTHVEQGYEVPPHYDSLLCKVIAHGKDRAEASDRMLAALGGLHCEGVPTTIPMHQAILRSKEFADNHYTTAAIPGFGSE